MISNTLFFITHFFMAASFILIIIAPIKKGLLNRLNKRTVNLFRSVPLMLSTVFITRLRFIPRLSPFRLERAHQDFIVNEPAASFLVLKKSKKELWTIIVVTTGPQLATCSGKISWRSILIQSTVNYGNHCSYGILNKTGFDYIFSLNANFFEIRGLS